MVALGVLYGSKEHEGGDTRARIDAGKVKESDLALGQEGSSVAFHG